MIATKHLLPVALTILATHFAFAGDADLDSTFGDGGVSSIYVGTTENLPSKITLQADGKILMCGSSRDNSSSGSYGYDVALVRLNSDGSLDTTFGEDGKLTTDIGSSHPVYTDDRGSSVLVQPDNKIIVAGTTRRYTKSNRTSFEWYMWDLLLLRYNADGSVDTDFGTNGQVVIDLNGKGNVPEGFNRIALQSDNKIIAVGYTYPANNRFLVMRFNTDGSPDTTFGPSGTGMLIEHFSVNTLEDAYSVVILPDDSVVVAGRGIKSDGFGTVSILKLTSEGLLDTTFNGSGKIATSVGISATARYVTSDASGRILVGGQAGGGGTVGGEQSAMIQRYNSDGSLDTTFNGTGTFITAFGDSRGESFNSLEIQDDGKILAAGNITNPYQLVLMRLNEDGTPDETFAAEGKSIVVIDGISSSYNCSTALQSDGKLLFGASFQVDRDQAFAVLRFGGPDFVPQWNAGYTDLGDGWQELPWFGKYIPLENDWIWHLDSGFTQVAAGLYYYCHDTGWLWTCDLTFPWTYNLTTGTWKP